MSTENEISTIEKDVVENAVKVQAGDMLRAKREQLGISQEEIADRLRLRLTIIKSIDENSYDFDQVATFTRGYLRSYAKAVSLDENEVLASFNGFNKTQYPDHEMQSFSRQTKREKHDRRIMKLTWIIFVVIIGISSIWWYQNQQDTLTDISVSDTDVAAPEVGNTETNANEPASPDRTQFEKIQDEDVSSPKNSPKNNALPSEKNDAMDSRDLTDVQVIKPEGNADVEQEIVITDVGSEPVEKSSNELSLTFTADCWVQVKDANGKTLVTGVEKAGDSLHFATKAPYSIILGAPEGVSMTFANESVDLSGYNTGKVARFTLP